MSMTRRDVLRFGMTAGASLVAAACGTAAQSPEARGRRRPTSTTTARRTTTSVGPPTTSDTLGSTATTGMETVTSASPSSSCCTAPTGGRWSDPATWVGGAVPSSGQHVAVTSAVVLDVDAEVSGLTIEDGATLSFDPSSSRTLTTTENVVVMGTLAMRPASAEIVQKIAFTGVKESRFVGGGMQVLDTDVGIWVTGNGFLDIAGAPKQAWTRATSSLAAGAQSISLAADPVGWRVGDELAITPTERPAAIYDDRHPSHVADIVTVAAIDGRTIRLTKGLSVAHPTVDAGPAGILGAEVLNLTRNVNVEGTPQGRAHIIIVHAMRAQSISNAALRYLAPGTDAGGVLGRYALHFHHCGDGSRGSVIDSVVARDCGGHAFVPHESAGTTWRNCVAHEVREQAYWWDAADQSVDTLYDRCVASNVRRTDNTKYTSGGFQLGLGPTDTNIVRGCVASNVQGYGFMWDANAEGDWLATDCIAHNSMFSGIWVWQNNGIKQVIKNFVSYRNNDFGIEHGAYGNAYRYEGGSMVENAAGPVRVVAISAVNDDGSGQLTFSGLYLDAAGTDFGITAADGSAVKALAPTLFENCTIKNAKQAGIHWDGDGRDALATIRGCRFDGNELLLSSAVGSSTRIEFSDSRYGSVVLSAAGRGRSVPEWNASII